MQTPDPSQAASLHLTKLGSKKLSEFIDQTGPIEIPDRYSEDPLMGLCQIIVGQQVSGQAAQAIWRNICQKHPNRAERLEILRDGPTEGLGLSRAKQRTLSTLLNRGESWLHEQLHAAPESRFKALTDLWGIGPWSVAMWELFVLKQSDIWSDGDLILKRMSEQLAQDASDSRLDWIERARPFRSFLALYCWKLNDTQIPIDDR